MLTESSLLYDLERHAFSTGGQPLCIYGDPAYPLRVHLQGPLEGAALKPHMFGDILNYLKFLDFN